MPAHNAEKNLNDAQAAGNTVVTDFGAEGLKMDVIAESTSAVGVTIDGILLKDNVITAGVFSGLLTSPSPSLAFGYGVGAGGAVTQGSGSGKGTAVTLSTPCGTITTDNAALAAAAEVTFTVTNTKVSVSDVIVLSIQSGGTSGEYLAHVTDVGTGAFDITLANMSSSSASDVVLINFSVLQVSVE